MLALLHKPGHNSISSFERTLIQELDPDSISLFCCPDLEKRGMNMWSFLVLTELTLAFVVYSTESAVMDRPGLGLRLVRSGLWFGTVYVWCTRRIFDKLMRAGMHVWHLVTLGWLLSLMYDRLPSTTSFYLAAWAMLAFTVWCIDSMTNQFVGMPARRALRAVFWFKAMVDYMNDHDSARQATAMLMIWIFLTCGWLLTLVWDRFGPTLQAWSL